MREKRQEALQYISCHISRTKNNFIWEKRPKSADRINELCLRQTWHQQLRVLSRACAKTLFTKITNNVRNSTALHSRLFTSITYNMHRTWCVCVLVYRTSLYTHLWAPERGCFWRCSSLAEWQLSAAAPPASSVRNSNPPAALTLGPYLPKTAAKH